MDKAKELAIEKIFHAYNRHFGETRKKLMKEALDEYAQQVSSPLIEILKVARCPNGNCDNNGTITTGTMGTDGLPEPEAGQCQWCDERNKLISNHQNQQ